MAASDPNRILRLLPLVTGAIGGSLLLFNRVLTPALVPSQARSDALGVLLSALLILTGLLWQRIQPRPPEAVVLIGEQRLEWAPELPETIRIELAWASQLLLTNTVTQSLLVWYDDRLLLRRGILPPQAMAKTGTIVDRVLKTQRPVYLVKLDLYPGRIEFDYLPENTQGLICQPLGDRGVLILGANAPRSYTKQDEQWIEGIAEKLTHCLSSIMNSMNRERVSD